MRKLTLALLLLLVSAKAFPSGEIRVEIPLSEMVALKVKNRRIYLLGLRHPRFYIVDFKGHILKTFGRRGRGPGEFMYISDFSIIDKEIWVDDTPLNKRVQVFDLNGNFLRSIILSEEQPVKVFFIGKTVYYLRRSYGSKGEKIKMTLYRKEENRSVPVYSFLWDPGKKKVYYFPSQPLPEFVGVKDKIFMVNLEDGTIRVLSRDGKEISVIKTGLPRRKITKAYIRKRQKLIEVLRKQSERMGEKFKISKRLPAVERVFRFGNCLVLQESVLQPPEIYHFYDSAGREIESFKSETLFDFSYPYWIEFTSWKDESFEITLHPLHLKACSE